MGHRHPTAQGLIDYPFPHVFGALESSSQAYKRRGDPGGIGTHKLGLVVG
jgi:hypothetical protein